MSVGSGVRNINYNDDDVFYGMDFNLLDEEFYNNH